MFPFLFSGLSRLQDNTVSQAAHQATSQQSQLTELELRLNKKIESLELAIAGLWELLKEKNGYTDEEIIEMIRNVDLRDGVEDGKVRQSIRHCKACGRQLLTRAATRCNWCGSPIEKTGII